MKKKTNKGLIFTILAVCFLLSGCREEWNPATGGEEQGEEIPDFGISLTLPFAEESVSLRSLGESEENAIQTVDILAFRVGDDGKDYFEYHTEGRPAVGNTAGARVQKFSFAAWSRTYQQRIVVITNAREKVQELLQASNWKNQEKNSMLASLEMTLGTDKKWNSINASNYTAFPMWGESNPIFIAYETSSVGAVSLLRMVAKMDVQLDQTVSGLTDKFKLKSARLYNVYTRGSIVPASLTAPTVPATAERYQGPIVYTDFGAPGVPDVAIRNSIYLFESPATDEHLQSTCLVIGGIYANDVTPTYYRIDFLESDGVTARDILRNYKYTVNITGILDRGHPDEQEAFESKAENMQTELDIWSGDDLAVAFNGQYFLYVNKNQFDFPREACTTVQSHNTLIVNTNYESSQASGWRIDNITDESGNLPANWLTVTAPNGTTNTGAYGLPNEESRLILTFGQNTTGQPRYAKIIFAAGRLRYTVNVVQSTRIGVSLIFYEGQGRLDSNDVLVPDGPVTDTLKFYYPANNMVGHKELPFTVTWTPQDADVRVFETHRYMQPINGIANFLNFTTNPPRLRLITSHNGIYVLNIGLEYAHTPADRQAMYYAQSAIGFWVSNGVETIERCIVFVCYPPE